MLKREVFDQAMKAGLYKKLAWLIGAFSIVNEAEATWQADKYPWRLVQLPSGNYVVNPDLSLELIEDAPVGQAIFEFQEDVLVTPDNLINCKKEITSTYGNWFVNCLLLVEAFGTKIEYLEGDIDSRRIEAIFLKNFHDNPATQAEEQADRFYVREYLHYAEALYFLTGLTQLCVWAATRKTLLPAPGIIELKNRLLAENEADLDKLATIAKIDAELVQHDLAYLKGDPGMNFLRGGKPVEVVRKKKYAMVGAETGLEDNSVHGVLIRNSLAEGWELDKIPIMNDTTRAGSYNRGAQTMLGGVSVKWLLRASSNMNIVAEDCGTTIGVSVNITPTNVAAMVGFTVLDDEGQHKIENDEAAGKYLGHTVYMRSPMFCRMSHTDFCKTCLGDRLALNPDALSVAVSEMGNTILGIFLAAMHGKKLSTEKMDYQTAIV